MPEHAARFASSGHVRLGTDAHDGLFSSYAPGQERPLGAYAVLAGAYLAASAGSALALRRAGRPLPERPRTGDLVLVGVASHKLSRLLAKDKVTSFLRAPFTRFQEASGHGEVEEQACGHGVRFVVGELLICPYCLSQWVATALTLGMLASPRLTRQLCSVFVAHTVSDFLQLAYRAAEEAA
ncbi:MAG TPA: DUF1360 domain-containing protein [Solirubrobacteraceae bacterium]|jgi:hypothetical protein